MVGNPEVNVKPSVIVSTVSDALQEFLYQSTEDEDLSWIEGKLVRTIGGNLSNQDAVASLLFGQKESTIGRGKQIRSCCSVFWQCSHSQR